MTKKVLIIVSLLAEASKSTITQIEKRIRNDASIPWCKNIEKVTIQDIDTSYKNLRKQGIPSNIARTLIKLYIE